jgi:hypothetical protein
MTEFAAGSHWFPSFVADLRLSSSVAYSALLLRVHEEELFIIFLHSGVLARPIRQATEILSPPFAPSSWM